MNSEMQKRFKAWDRGEFLFPDRVQEKLGGLKEGEKLAGIMRGCTLCAVRNATCHHFIDVKLYKYNPEKGGKGEEVRLCALGCDSKTCVLNK